MGGGVGVGVGCDVGTGVGVGASVDRAVAVGAGVVATTGAAGCWGVITPSVTTVAATTPVTIQFGVRPQPGRRLHMRKSPKGKNRTSVRTVNQVVLYQGRDASGAGDGGDHPTGGGVGGGVGGIWLAMVRPSRCGSWTLEASTLASRL